MVDGPSGILDDAVYGPGVLKAQLLVDHFETDSLLRLLPQPVRGARQELRAAVLFLPDLHDADLGICDLALRLGLRDPKMPDDHGVPNHLHCHFGKVKRLDGRLPPMTPLYELGLVLERG